MSVLSVLVSRVGCGMWDLIELVPDHCPSFYSFCYTDPPVPDIGWSGRVMQWCWENFQCRGVLLNWSRVGEGPTALAVGAGGGCLDIFSLVYHFSFLSLGDGPI